MTKLYLYNTKWFKHYMGRSELVNFICSNLCKRVCVLQLVRLNNMPVSYLAAKANCQAKGGSLIKIDSKEKYDIFKDYHGIIYCAITNISKPEFKCILNVANRLRL